MGTILFYYSLEQHAALLFICTTLPSAGGRPNCQHVLFTSLQVHQGQYTLNTTCQNKLLIKNGLLGIFSFLVLSPSLLREPLRASWWVWLDPGSKVKGESVRVSYKENSTAAICRLCLTSCTHFHQLRFEVNSVWLSDQALLSVLPTSTTDPVRTLNVWIEPSRHTVVVQIVVQNTIIPTEPPWICFPRRPWAKIRRWISRRGMGDRATMSTVSCS